MELKPVNPTAKAPASNFTGDVYVTPIYNGTEPPPDTFKDNAQALAEGSFRRDNVFEAKQIQAKCASKYAPQQPNTAANSASSSEM